MKDVKFITVTYITLSRYRNKSILKTKIDFRSVLCFVGSF